MRSRFEYQSVSEWPSHAWITRLVAGDGRIRVWHGPDVQVGDDWYCEAIWDGEFGEGGFDATDIVAGSGARRREVAVTFVSSGSTVDRLQYLQRNDAIFVSNSLACLLSQTGLGASVAYPHYLRDFNSIVKGIRDYTSPLPLVDGTPAQLVYFDNLQWDGVALRRSTKPCAHRSFRTFDQYHGFLNRSLERLAENMADPGRTLRYRMLGTLSTGYDSATVTALAGRFGLQEVLCFERGNDRDIGTRIAHYFGVTPIPVNVQAWRKLPFPEVSFIAGDAFGEEVHYSAAADRLHGRLLLTGYHGDKVWDRDTPSPYLTPDIKRGDISGLALTEFRLRAGFINCPVPFWSARNIEDIHGISRSDEMSPWDVAGDYSRPICRRIVESIGVPREAFGVAKSFASQWISLAELDISAGSRHDFSDFLRSHRRTFLGRGRIPPGMFESLDRALMEAAYAVGGALVKMPGFYRMGFNDWPVARALAGLRFPNPPHAPLVIGPKRYMFAWAMSRAVCQYSRIVDPL